MLVGDVSEMERKWSTTILFFIIIWLHNIFSLGLLKADKLKIKELIILTFNEY